jgi:Kef-type K+ transport system membrane component KefB
MDLFKVFTTTSSTVTGEPYTLLLPIALILILAKILAIVCQKLKLPQVVGFLVAGLLLGLIKLIPNQEVFTAFTLQGLDDLAKIGVILIMFSAGLETDLKQIKSVGWPSLVITSLGVLFPLAFGAGVAFLFFPSNTILQNLFYGVILSATSVSITVATLKELHKLDTRVGMAIVSAAIIDDIIGIILLSLVISLAGAGQTTQYVDNSTLNIVIMIGLMIAFFIVAFIVGIFVRKLFKWLDEKWPNHRRIPIFSLAVCFLYAYCAQKFFGIADITGAYCAGLIISTTKPKEYVDSRTETSSQIFFAPIFFASISLKLYDIDFSTVDIKFIWFGLAFVLAGLLGKVIGAGLGGLMTKFKFKESLIIGVGMMSRAEVVIVTAKTGVDAGLIGADQPIMPFVLLLIIVSSLITPILLKVLYKDDATAGPTTYVKQREHIDA